MELKLFKAEDYEYFSWLLISLLFLIFCFKISFSVYKLSSKLFISVFIGKLFILPKSKLTYCSGIRFILSVFMKSFLSLRYYFVTGAVLSSRLGESFPTLFSFIKNYLKYELEGGQANDETGNKLGIELPWLKKSWDRISLKDGLLIGSVYSIFVIKSLP